MLRASVFLTLGSVLLLGAWLLVASLWENLWQPFAFILPFVYPALILYAAGSYHLWIAVPRGERARGILAAGVIVSAVAIVALPVSFRLFPSGSWSTHSVGHVLVYPTFVFAATVFGPIVASHALVLWSEAKALWKAGPFLRLAALFLLSLTIAGLVVQLASQVWLGQLPLWFFSFAGATSAGYALIAMVFWREVTGSSAPMLSQES